MSAPLRFLALVVVGWGAMRLYSATGLTGVTLLDPTPEAQAAVPPLAMTEFPELPPDAYAAYPQPSYYAHAPRGVMPPAVPVYYYYPMPVRQPAAKPVYQPAQQTYSPRPVLDLRMSDAGPEWSLASVAASAFPPSTTAPPTVVPRATPIPPKLDRLQLSSWALLRGTNGSPALANGGTLGGSQAGARLTYAFNRSLAASLRSTSPVGGRGVEVALGARYQPLQSVPVWLTAERRQAFGRDGGRSAFALFAEGGLYAAPMPLDFQLDAYLQAGVVGASRRDLFADGALAFTRPVYKNYSAGFGVWGGVQPGLYRVDAGPRVSVRVKDNIRMHLDWRQRLAGKALPDSGPALTLAADF